MKYIFLTIAGLAFVLGVHAQSVGPVTLNAQGGSATVGGNTFEWSIAEMTLVSTATAPNIVVTQGVLQPMPPATGVKDNKYLAENLKVYPIPTQGVLYLEPSFLNGGTLSYLLMDANGKTIARREVILNTGHERQSVDMNAFAAGNYMLQVQYNEGGSVNTNTFKVQKLH